MEISSIFRLRKTEACLQTKRQVLVEKDRLKVPEERPMEGVVMGTGGRASLGQGEGCFILGGSEDLDLDIAVACGVRGGDRKILCLMVLTAAVKKQDLSV